MMRRYLSGLALVIGGVIGVLASWLVVQALTDQLLHPGHSPFDAELLAQPLLLAPIVVPPLLVAGVLVRRGWRSAAGLFLLGWGCLWPIELVYAAGSSIGASLSGGSAPSISLISGPGPVVLSVFFAVLPLAGLWLASAGLRQHRAEGTVTPV